MVLPSRESLPSPIYAENYTRKTSVFSISDEDENGKDSPLRSVVLEILRVAILAIMCQFCYFSFCKPSEAQH